jgi:hypothetical protein
LKFNDNLIIILYSKFEPKSLKDVFLNVPNIFHLKETYSRKALGTGSKKISKVSEQSTDTQWTKRTNQKFRAKLRHPMYKKENIIRRRTSDGGGGRGTLHLVWGSVC